MSNNFKFGDIVKNIYTSTSSSTKYSYFIRSVNSKSETATDGGYAECTDGKGNVWKMAQESLELHKSTDVKQILKPYQEDLIKFMNEKSKVRID